MRLHVGRLLLSEHTTKNVVRQIRERWFEASDEDIAALILFCKVEKRDPDRILYEDVREPLLIRPSIHYIVVAGEEIILQPNDEGVIGQVRI